MPRIRCRYEDCVFLEDGYCGAAAIELEPETGCLTYSRVEEAVEEEEDWEEEEVEDLDDDDDEAWDDDEDDDWEDDEGDY